MIRIRNGLIACTLVLSGTTPLYGLESAAVSSRSLDEEPVVRYLTSAPYERRPGIDYPDDPAAFYRERQKTKALVAQGRCAEALPLLERLVVQYADDGLLWLDLGTCREEAGDEVGAIDALEAALELGAPPVGNRFDAYATQIMSRIGWLHARMGHESEALAWLERSLVARNTSRASLANAEGAALFEGNKEFAALAGVAPAGISDRDEQWRYDIEFFRDQVALLHWDPDHRTPASEIETALDGLLRDVPALSDKEIVASLALIMGKLGAGHDILFAGTAGSGAPEWFAMRAYMFDDGLYIVEAQDPTLVGARIDAFGSTPTAEAYRAVEKAAGGDNLMTVRWSAPTYLLNPTILELLGVIEDADAAELAITGADGRQRTITPDLAPPYSNSPSLVAPPAVTAPRYLAQLDLTYWLAELDESETIYAQVNGLTDAQDESFSLFVGRLIEAFVEARAKHLVIDLRHNIGGSSALGDNLLKALVYFDMMPGKGDLYILIGRNTFSSAQELITRANWLTDAVFVGEPSGSRPNFIGRTGQFTLPFSGLSGMLSSEYGQASWPEDHRIWIAPDVPVGLTSEQYFAGEDPVLAAVRRLITENAA